MKKYLFSSGEVMFEKNLKQLEEGLFVAEFMRYADVGPDTEYICVGRLNDKEAEISFVLADDQLEHVKMKHTYNILMQSDLLNANWKEYRVSYT
ncbi:MAG: hypothetical protein GX384_03090 [Clostridiaceae bacterium]|jgi:hypothetical protein|nr:hypothetical protein [Bacillota bacterium]NLI38315.1 hypothetical protein [Clostridiaceae bacterium]